MWHYQGGLTGITAYGYLFLVTQIFLPQVITRVQNLRPRSRLNTWLLHHDNASAQVWIGRVGLREKSRWDGNILSNLGSLTCRAGFLSQLGSASAHRQRIL